jgi:hypothetical protein
MLEHVKRTTLLGALAAALGAAVAGCGGGGGGDSSNGGERLSKAAYGARLSAICKDYNDYTSSLDDPSSMKEIKPWINKVLPRFQVAISDAKELSPPQDLQDEHDEFLSIADDETSVLHEMADAAEANDQQKLLDLEQQGTKLDNRSDKLAHQLGARECAAG